MKIIYSLLIVPAVIAINRHHKDTTMLENEMLDAYMVMDDGTENDINLNEITDRDIKDSILT